MRNVKKVVNVLLLATTFGTACHQLDSQVAPIKLTAFLTTEGNQHKLVLSPAATLPAVPEEPVGYGTVYTVTATAYQAVEAQTDDEPFVTADNSFIKPGYSSKIHWLAVSQDLLVHWGGKIKYGDQVQVCGVSPELDGLYTVHDTMNKRHHHCIDILSSPREKFDIFTKGVKIQRFAALPAAKKRALQPLLASHRATRPGRPAEWRPRRYTKSASYLVSAIW